MNSSETKNDISPIGDSVTQSSDVKANPLDNLHETTERFFDLKPENSIKRSIINFIMVALIFGLLLAGAIGFLSAHFLSFVGKVVLFPIIFIGYIFANTGKAIATNLVTFLIGVGIFSTGVWYLDKTRPTIWVDAVGIYDKLTHHVKNIVGHTGIGRELIEILDFSSDIPSLEIPEFKKEDFSDLGSWVKRVQLPLPNNAIDALSELKDGRLLEKYGSLIKEGIVKQDASNLATLLREELFVNDAVIREEAYKAMGQINTKESEKYLEEYRNLLQQMVPKQK